MLPALSRSLVSERGSGSVARDWLLSLAASSCSCAARSRIHFPQIRARCRCWLVRVSSSPSHMGSMFTAHELAVLVDREPFDDLRAIDSFASPEFEGAGASFSVEFWTAASLTMSSVSSRRNHAEVLKRDRPDGLRRVTVGSARPATRDQVRREELRVSCLQQIAG